MTNSEEAQQYRRKLAERIAKENQYHEIEVTKLDITRVYRVDNPQSHVKNILKRVENHMICIICGLRIEKKNPVKQSHELAEIALVQIEYDEIIERRQNKTEG
jgi:hypothetical protein